VQNCGGFFWRISDFKVFGKENFGDYLTPVLLVLNFGEFEGELSVNLLKWFVFNDALTHDG